MRKPKLVALVVAFIMTATMSMPTFAFAEDPAEKDLDGEQAGVTRDVQGTENVEDTEGNVSTPDQVQEEELNTITTESGNTETESPASDFKYSIYNNKVTINGYVGTGAEVVIPNAIEGLPVTSIGRSAFKGCSNLSSVTIPDRVRGIGSSAFYGCSGLSSITIPSGVTSIGESSFHGCNSLSSITIPEGVTSIGSGTFSKCSNLSSITIPDSVTSIGDHAFEGCSNLSSITIPEGVTSIGFGAFYDCSNLSSITIPEGVTSIGESSFHGCNSLSSITIPEGVTSIGSGTFSKCSNLSSITIPSSVTSIGKSAFYDCSNLSSITIPERVTSIGDYAFHGCSSLSSITIPSSVASIGSHAFSGCSNLLSVKLLYGVKSIGNGAFSNCSKLSYISIPDSVTSIGSYAFSGCSNISNITIPEGVASIGERTFSSCRSLSSVTIPSSVTSIGSSAFEDCSSLSSITIPDSVTSIGAHAFEGCNSLSGNIAIPSGVTSIEYSTFYNCSSISSITIPEGVTSIGSSAFRGCSKLTEIKLPASILVIGDRATTESAKLVVYENSVGHEYAIANNLSYEIDYNEIKATSVTLNKETIELEIGDYFTLTAEVLPEDALQKWIKWSTDNSEAIKLNDDGTVVALKPGEATVTATTAHGLTATCHVTVTHVHDWDEGTVIQEVSCTDDEITKYVCTSCAKSRTETTAEALSHQWNQGEVATEPTCDAEGEKVFTCERCSEEKSESIEATGHSYAEELTAGNKTHWNECHCGAKANEEAHNWHAEYRTVKEAKCTEAGSKAIFCKDCDAKKAGSEVTIDALGHAYGTITIDPTCSQKGYELRICGRCGDTKKDKETPAKGHSFGQWQTIKDSSCTEEGSEQRICGECGYIETRGVAKKEHAWESDYTIDKDVTCTTDGSKSIHCKDCEAVKDSKVIEATGHKYTNWEVVTAPTCEAAGLSKRICTECEVEETLEIDKRAHDWKEEYTVDTKATCTEKGSKSIHCRDCEAVKDSKVIEATGHKYTNWEVVTAPTCEAAGLSKRICTECEVEETLEIDKRAHDWKEEYTVDTKATCTEKGSKSIHCSDCEAVKEGSSVEIAIKDHHYGDWTISKPATFGKDGIKKRTCTDCEASDTEELPIPAVVNRVIVLDPCVYDGTEQTPEIIIFNTDGNVLKEGRDYEKTYTNNINAGTGNVTVTLCGDKYEGELTGKFNIAKADAKIDAPDRIKVRAKKSVSLDAKSDSEGAITYETSNKKYATVSSAGIVKGVKVGTATITVSVAGDANHNANTKTVDVNVPTVITKATLTKTSFTYDGEEHVPDVNTVNGKKTLVEGIDYTVSPPEEATDAGTYYVTVTATEDGKYDGSYKAKYTIKKATQTISYDVPKVYVNGDEENLNASTPGTGQITYKSSSSKILKVDAEGNLIGVKAGTAYITMTAPADTNYNKATKKVKVTVYKKDNILTTEIEPSVTLTVGETLDIGAKATGGTITYSSNKKTYAPVSSTGTITAKKAGTVTITVKAGDNEYNTVTKKITVKVIK